MLRGILRRRTEIKPAALFVSAAKTNYVEIPVRNQLHALSVSRNKVGMPPAVPLAEPEKIRSVVKPFDFRHHVDPGCILISKNWADGAARAIGDQNIIGILQTIQMLDGELV